MTTAVMNRPQHVPTEIHIERQLIEREGAIELYAYRLVGEGTVLAEAGVWVPALFSREDQDNVGISRLLLALAA